MKQNNKQNNLAFLLEQGRVSSIRGVSIPLLFNLSKNTTKGVFISVKNSVLDFFSTSFLDGETPNLCLFYDTKNFSHIAAFPSYYEKINKKTISKIENKKQFLCLYSENCLNLNLFNIGKKNKKKIDTSIGFDSLIQILNDFGYIKGKAVRGGLYFTMGGVVDFWDPCLDVKYRASFLGKTPSFFVVDKKNNLISKKVSSFYVYGESYNKKTSISSFPDAVLLKYKKGCITTSNIEAPSLNVFSQNIEFQGFNIKKNCKNFYLLPSGFEFGFKIDGRRPHIPSWFIKKTPSSSRVSSALSSFENYFKELRVGAVYIHEDFGFCKLLSVQELDDGSFVVLKFEDGTVRLSFEKISKIFFFAEKRQKGFSFLNRPGLWTKKRALAIKAADNFATSLLSSYIKRISTKRVGYIVSDPFIKSFVSSFKHLDTVDQKKCWEEIKKDLCGESPMNRLVCGDVGFGKTEIAIRASFVAVFNKKRVVVLAPTTILSHQLYRCFSQRVGSFGVSVGILSRTTKKNNLTILGFLENSIDVLIGTHSILNQPAILSACDLFIIDEEHRFGVNHKEKILKINPMVNLLLLSATPIPRTMQFALNKLSNLSVISSPPIARKPIITNVCYFSKPLIKNAIIKEFNRNGQVFFVDNSVENLKKMFFWVSCSISTARPSLVFSKQTNSSLIKNMEDFQNKKTNILFSTTIIESGLDLHAVNTIIINNSQNFGLSQLYQLRGRVGRAHLQSYSFLLVPKKPISLNAEKRLYAISSSTTLGTNYLLAMKDLEIRGFGSLFGYKQTGDSGVGVAFYLSLLESLIKNKLFNKGLTKKPCSVDIYKQNKKTLISIGPAQKLGIYNKINFAQNTNELRFIKKQVSSFFGEFPEEVLPFYKNKYLSVLGTNAGLFSIYSTNKSVCFSFSSTKTNIKKITTFSSSFFLKAGIFFKFTNNNSGFVFVCNPLQRCSFLILKTYLRKLSSYV